MASYYDQYGKGMANNLTYGDIYDKAGQQTGWMRDSDGKLVQSKNASPNYGNYSIDQNNKLLKNNTSNEYADYSAGSNPGAPSQQSKYLQSYLNYENDPKAIGSQAYQTEYEKSPQAQAGHLADEFRQNSGQLGDSVYSDLAQKERKRFAEEMGTIKSQANSRGLLHSGIREGQEASARVASAGQIGKLRQGVNEQISDQQRSYDEAAVTGQMASAMTEGQMNDLVYNQALNSMLSNRQAMGSILGAGGLLAGNYLANRQTTPAQLFTYGSAGSSYGDTGGLV